MSVPVQATADALFGGCGYVPDVTSLQAWLECAWVAGFDPTGAEQLGGCASGASCIAVCLPISCTAVCWSRSCPFGPMEVVCPC